MKTMISKQAVIDEISLVYNTAKTDYEFRTRIISYQIGLMRSLLKE